MQQDQRGKIQFRKPIGLLFLSMHRQPMPSLPNIKQIRPQEDLLLLTSLIRAAQLKLSKKLIFRLVIMTTLPVTGNY